MTSPGPLPVSRSTPRVWLLVALIALAQAGLLAHTAWDKSDTADEPTYMAVAVRQWQGDFTANCESPALPKWGFGLALRLVDAELFDPQSKRGRDPLWSRFLPETRRNLMAARSATILVTVLGGVLLFLCGRRTSTGTGLLAQALWACSPTTLANGSLATLDAWAAAGCALVLWLGLRCYERPSATRAALLGEGLALSAACKVTTLGLVPLALLLVALAVRRESPPKAWRAALGRLLALGAGFAVTLWLVYGLSVATLRTDSLCGRPSAGLGDHDIGPLPFAPWIEGLLQQVLHGEIGHRGYLFGEVRFTGWWWFFLAALALKTTLGAQGLVGLRLASAWRARPSSGAWRYDLALLAYPSMLLLLMSAGRTQNGIKYLLPAWPFAVLWLARTLPEASRAFGPLGRNLTLGLALVGTAESLRVHPHHLMFFNAWAGGPEGGPRYLIHGDDWGQDQRRVAEWQREHRPWRLYYTYYNGNPHHWGVSYEEPACTPKIGFYALQAVELHRPKRSPPGCFDWLTVEPPDERLGYSIYLYEVSKARIERLGEERERVKPFWKAPPPPPSQDEDEPAGEPKAQASGLEP